MWRIARDLAYSVTPMSEGIEHNCGIALTYHIPGTKNVVPMAFDIACNQENRGEDAAGIAYIGEGNSLRLEKKIGLASVVLKEIAQTRFGTAALVHNRYQTSGRDGNGAAQPFHYPSVHPSQELVIGHNGNIDSSTIETLLQAAGRGDNIASDTDAIGRLLKMRFEEGKGIKAAMKSVWSTLDGAHNLAVLRRDGTGMVSRDQRGTHPLVIGRKDDVVVVASEDHAIRHALGNQVKMRDVEPGELVELRRNGEPISHKIAKATPAHCIFEWWYFAKQWSRLDGASVYTTRHRAGERLASLDEAMWEQMGIEPIIVPVPNSAHAIAAGYQHELSLLSNVGAIIRNKKTKKVPRTFISDPSQRKRKVEEKYHFKHEKAAGEDVILIDDSIVRGPTMQEIIKQMRSKPDMQPRSVHVRIAFPPVLAPCFYGINMSTLEELFMTKFRLMEQSGATQEQIEVAMAQDLGADSVRFLPVSMVSDVLGIDDAELCHACTRAQYPTASGQCKHDANARLLGLLPME